MPTIQLVHWNAAEARPLAERLTAAGYAVASDVSDVPALLKRLRAAPPVAVVIDLSRLPSQGRDIGMALRVTAVTRGVPLLFVGGDPLKVDPIRARLPDAVYATWDGIEETLAQAIASPPRHPVAIRSQLDGYSGKPLLTKLGIRPGMRVALAGEPEGFRALLDPLPEGAAFCSLGETPFQLVVWFVRSGRELQDGMPPMAQGIGAAGLWVAWPKRTSSLVSDVGEKEVRSFGLALGLVDFKVCAIDSTWSGLLFKRRKTG
jgi:CheY-like chemotaxis protein